MDHQKIKEKCVAKLRPRCTSEENAVIIYEDFVRNITKSSWHLMNLSTRDEVMTTAIIQAIKDDVVNIVLHNWAEGEYNHYPNDSDVAHAVGAVLLLLTNDVGGESYVYEKASY